MSWVSIAMAGISTGIDYSQSKDANAEAYKQRAKQTNQAIDRQEKREKERKKAAEKAQAQAADAQRRRADSSRRDGSRRGRASNILTSAAGLREEDSAKQTLLGGSTKQ